MKEVVCDKCGKIIEKNVHTMTYRTLMTPTCSLDFCDDCFKEIVKYRLKKQRY